MKKVISFVLVLALVLGSFSMAFAAPLTDVEESANAEAITVVNDLGIVTGYEDGTFQPAKAVTRAEFAAMITRALGVPESALAGYTTTTFGDTAGYGWAVKYLAFCADKGIIVGDGNGNVMPGRTINVNEAMTMVLRAVGFTNNSAQLVGTWPGNYVTLAQDLDLYDDVAAVATVDRASAAQIIYNALTVQKVQVDADGATNGIWLTDSLGNSTPVSMLTSGLGCDIEAAAIIEGDEDTLINLNEYKGAYAVTYTKDGDIVAIGDVKSTFLTGTYTSTSGIFETTDEVEYKLASGTAITTAGIGVDNGDVSDIAGNLVKNEMPDDDTYTIAVSLKGKTVQEVYSVIDWDVDATYKYDADNLFEGAYEGHDFVLTEDDEIDVDSFILEGAATLDKIAKDSVVEVYLNGNGEIAKLAVGTETVTGAVSKVTATKWYINGTGYYKAAAAPTITLGDEGTAYLNIDGDIAIWEKTKSGAEGNYAVVIATKAATSAWTDATTEYAIKLYTAAGETIEVDVDADEAGLTTAAMGMAADQLVEFALNKDGELSDVTTGAVKTSPSLTNVAKDGSLFGNKVVASNVVVFVKDATDGSYSIEKITALKKDATSSMYAVLEDEISAVVVGSAQLDNGDATLGLINAVSKATNADGDKVVYVEGFLGGVALDAYTDEPQASYNTGVWVATTTTAGLQNITVNTDGVVTDVTGVAVGANLDVEAYTTFGGATISAVNNNTRNITIDGVGTYRVAEGATIYVWDADEEAWTIGTLSALKGKYVHAYTTDVDDVIGYDVILAWK